MNELEQYRTYVEGPQWESGQAFFRGLVTASVSTDRMTEIEPSLFDRLAIEQLSDSMGDALPKAVLAVYEGVFLIQELLHQVSQLTFEPPPEVWQALLGRVDRSRGDAD